jgi:hypothetical protein
MRPPFFLRASGSSTIGLTTTALSFLDVCVNGTYLITPLVCNFVPPTYGVCLDDCVVSGGEDALCTYYYDGVDDGFVERDPGAYVFEVLDTSIASIATLVSPRPTAARSDDVFALYSSVTPRPTMARDVDEFSVTHLQDDLK